MADVKGERQLFAINELCNTCQVPTFLLHAVTHLQANWPRQRFYWGYIWDGTGNRVTAPIRNTRNKSHMPVSQVRV